MGCRKCCFVDILISLFLSPLLLLYLLFSLLFAVCVWMASCCSARQSFQGAASSLEGVPISHGFVTAFPDYGNKSKSGLRGVGPQRIAEAHEQTESRVRAARREKQRDHLKALKDHGLTPSEVSRSTAVQPIQRPFR